MGTVGDGVFTATAADNDQGTTGSDGTTVQVHWRVGTLDRRSPPDATNPATGTGSADEPIVLIQLQARNPEPVPQRLRLENRLEGPVLYPRRQGVAERGWDRDGFEGSIPAETTRALGYACPATVETPPVRVVAMQGGEMRSGTSPENPHSPTAAAVVREYGVGTPPRQVTAATTTTGEGSTDLAVETAADQSDGNGSSNSTRDSELQPASEQVGSPSADPTRSKRGEDLPPEVVDWFEEVEQRLEQAERIQNGSVADATTVLAAAGGLSGILDAVEALDGDTAALREIEARAGSLAERVEDVDVPETSLRRLT